MVDDTEIRVLFCSSVFTEKVCCNWARSAVAPGTHWSRIRKNKLKSTEANQTGFRSSKHGEIHPQTGHLAETISESCPFEILKRDFHRKSKCHS